MAKRNGRVQSDNPPNTSKGFLVVEFDHNERSEYTEWAKHHPTLLSDLVTDVCDGGWKLSISYSERYGCYFGSVTDKTAGTQYNGYTLSVKHVDPDKLCSLLRFLVGVLCADNRVSLPRGSDDISW